MRIRRTRRNDRSIIFITGVIVLIILSLFSEAPRRIAETQTLVIEEESLLAACIPLQEGQRAEYIRVVDGDTAIFRIEGEDRRIRYIGINTPEKGQDYSWDATIYNEELLSSAGAIWLYKDVSDTDRYNRLLRYVVVEGKFVNYLLIENGYAQVMMVSPDVACADMFLEAQETARREKRGLWGK